MNFPRCILFYLAIDEIGIKSLLIGLSWYINLILFCRIILWNLFSLSFFQVLISFDFSLSTLFHSLLRILIFNSRYFICFLATEERLRNASNRVELRWNTERDEQKFFETWVERNISVSCSFHSLHKHRKTWARLHGKHVVEVFLRCAASCAVAVMHQRTFFTQISRNFTNFSDF